MFAQTAMTAYNVLQIQYNLDIFWAKGDQT